MALIYHPNIRNLYTTNIFAGFAAPSAITVYAGTQPTAATLASNWATYNSANSNLLWHTQGVTYSITSGITMFASTVPAAVAALNTGTVAWCILWTSNVTQASLASGTIPNTKFLIGDASNTSGTGVIRFTSSTMTSGVAVPFIDCGITIT